MKPFLTSVFGSTSILAMFTFKDGLGVCIGMLSGVLLTLQIYKEVRGLRK